MRPLVRWVILAAGMFLLGALFADSQFFRPNISGTKDVEAEWQLPPLPDKQALKHDYTRLVQRYQSVTMDSAGEERASIPWQLIGISMEGGVYYALIKIDQTVARYQKGEHLTNGTLLSHINDDSIRIETAAGTEQLWLYNPPINQ